jgi:hypothetical protein
MDLKAALILSIPAVFSVVSGVASRRIWSSKKKVRLRIASYSFFSSIVMISVYSIYAFYFWRPDVLEHGWKLINPIWGSFYFLSYVLMFFSFGLIAAMEGMNIMIRILILLIGYIVAVLIYNVVNMAAFDL